MKMPEKDRRSNQWGWVEPSVGSQERLLRLFENNLGQCDDVYSAIYNPDNLHVAYQKVKANNGSPGDDGITMKEFEQDPTYNLTRIQKELCSLTYQPGFIRRVWLMKDNGKLRPLGIPNLRDRIVQTALRLVIEPIFEKDFLPCSYGFRPGVGCHDALRALILRLQSGHNHVLGIDIHSCFDSIPHARILELVKERINNPRTLELTRILLEQRTESEPPTPYGIPQGSCISPLLANIFLHDLDHKLVHQGFQPIRYADDIVIPCTTHQETKHAKELVNEWLIAHNMKFHPTKTQIKYIAFTKHTTNESADTLTFLGHTFKQDGTINPSGDNVESFKNKISNITSGKTRQGRKLRRRAVWDTVEILKEVNNLTASWRAYFTLCHKHTLHPLDKWLRGHMLHKLLHHAERNGTPRHSVGLQGLASLVTTAEKKVGGPSTFPERQGIGSESADSSDLDGNKKLQLKPMEVKHA